MTNDISGDISGEKDEKHSRCTRSCIDLNLQEWNDWCCAKKNQFVLKRHEWLVVFNEKGVRQRLTLTTGVNMMMCVIY